MKGTGFGTLAFGCERPFVIRETVSKNREKIMHKSGEMIELPYPMNSYYTHQVPSYSKALGDKWRISLTFREIEEFVCGEKRWQPPWLVSARAHRRRTWVWVG